MTFLEVLQRNQRVINSCVTVEQAKNSRLYTRLVNRRWGETNIDEKSVKGWSKSVHDLHELADYTKFMREAKIKKLMIDISFGRVYSMC